MPVLLILVSFDILWALEKPDVEIMSEIIGRVIMFTVLPCLPCCQSLIQSDQFRKKKCL